MSNSIRTAFHEYFRVLPVDTDSLRKEVFRIRYEVYCKELGYEKPNQFPDRQEYDDYDVSSFHCLLLHKASNQFAGCIRLVSAKKDNSRHALPFECICSDKIDRSIIELEKLDPESYGEISRLAVCANFRRRAGEQNTPAGIMPEPCRVEEGKRSFPLVAFGLYLSAAAVGLNLGLERVFAMMEPRLARSLRMFGIHFQQIGFKVEHRGMRAPFQITKDALYKNLSKDVADLLVDFQEALEIAISKTAISL